MKLEREIDIFIEGVRRYFKPLSKADQEVTIGTPFLIKHDQPMGLDYTGLIAVSGDARGVVLFSASKVMLKYILLRQSETKFDEIYLHDIAGEVANTIAGNARQHLGARFHISPPRVLNGKIERRHLSSDSRSYVIPLRWRKNGAELIVSLSYATS